MNGLGFAAWPIRLKVRVRLVKVALEVVAVVSPTGVVVGDSAVLVVVTAKAKDACGRVARVHQVAAVLPRAIVPPAHRARGDTVRVIARDLVPGGVEADVFGLSCPDDVGGVHAGMEADHGLGFGGSSRAD